MNFYYYYYVYYFGIDFYLKENRDLIIWLKMKFQI